MNDNDLEEYWTDDIEQLQGLRVFEGLPEDRFCTIHAKRFHGPRCSECVITILLPDLINALRPKTPPPPPPHD